MITLKVTAAMTNNNYSSTCKVVICYVAQCSCTVYPNKYAHGFCFAVLCCGYTLTDFPISIRLTSLALWQSNDCPSASKATLMIMDKYFMWIHYERLHNHNKAKHNKTVCIFLGIYVPVHLARSGADTLVISVVPGNDQQPVNRKYALHINSFGTLYEKPQMLERDIVLFFRMISLASWIPFDI